MFDREPKISKSCYLSRCGLYRVRVTFSRDPITGVKPKTQEYTAKLEREAICKAKAAAKAKPTIDKKTSFADFLRLEFFPFEYERYHNNVISWSHYEGRFSTGNKHIVNAKYRLGSIRLGLLTPGHVQQFFDDLMKVSVSRVVQDKLCGIIRAALRKCRDRIPERVSDYFETLTINAPKIVKERKAVDGRFVEKQILNPDLPLSERCLVAFLFTMPFRPQDAFALEWTDFDFKQGIVYLTKAVRKEEGGYKISRGDKNGKVRGAYQLEPQLIPLLKALRKASTSNLVFPGPKGPWNANYFSRYQWDKIRERFKISGGVPFYNLKHAGHTLAVERGASMQLQADRMGHSTTTMAERVYRNRPKIVPATGVYFRPREGDLRG